MTDRSTLNKSSQNQGKMNITELKVKYLRLKLFVIWMVLWSISSTRCCGTAKHIVDIIITSIIQIIIIKYSLIILTRDAVIFCPFNHATQLK